MKVWFKAIGASLQSMWERMDPVQKISWVVYSSLILSFFLTLLAVDFIAGALLLFVFYGAFWMGKTYENLR